MSWAWHCPACDCAHVCDERWAFNGNLERPTFGPSIRVTYDGKDAGIDGAPPAVCHSHVNDGYVAYCDDCTHALRGQTVEIPVWATRYTSRLRFPIPIRAVVRVGEKKREACTREPLCDPPWHEFTVFSYVLPDGTPTKFSPGDAFIDKHEGPCSWTNCDGWHLHVGIPVDGYTHDWDVDARASNCDLKSDMEHRCWVKHGSAREGTLNIDKAGRTCHAGAGSIQVAGDPGFHGFVRKGKLVAA